MSISDGVNEDSDKLASLSESEASGDEVPRLKGKRRKRKNSQSGENLTKKSI